MYPKGKRTLPGRCPAADEVLEKGKSLGLNVMRTWAFHDGRQKGKYPLQVRWSNSSAALLSAPVLISYYISVTESSREVRRAHLSSELLIKGSVEPVFRMLL